MPMGAYPGYHIRCLQKGHLNVNHSHTHTVVLLDKEEEKDWEWDTHLRVNRVQYLNLLQLSTLLLDFIILLSCLLFT